MIVWLILLTGILRNKVKQRFPLTANLMIDKIMLEKEKAIFESFFVFSKYSHACTEVNNTMVIMVLQKTWTRYVIHKMTIQAAYLMVAEPRLIAFACIGIFRNIIQPSSFQFLMIHESNFQNLVLN